MSNKRHNIIFQRGVEAHRQMLLKVLDDKEEYFAQNRPFTECYSDLREALTEEEIATDLEHDNHE